MTASKNRKTSPASKVEMTMLPTKSLWQVVIVLMAVLPLTLNLSLGGSNVDVQAEIDRLAEKISGFNMPNKIMIDSFVQQVQLQCPNQTIDESIYESVSGCMERNFNHTMLQEEFREAIPEGRLDEVFQGMCLKWPLAKSCLQDLTDLIDGCWAKGDQVNTIMDSMVGFFCGEKNDGERVALFFADGGVNCVEERGEEVKECVLSDRKFSINANKIDAELPSEEEICQSLKHFYDCGEKGLGKCQDSTPENIFTSMLRVVAKAVHCNSMLEQAPPRRSSGARTALSLVLLLSSVITLLHSS